MADSSASNTLPRLNVKHDEELIADSSASDSEYQHALEVILDAENQHRRKSSLVASDTPGLAEKIARDDRRTQCKVHQLLELQRKAARAGTMNGLKDVSEDSMLDKAGGAAAGEKEKEKDGEQSQGSRLMTKKQLNQMAIGVRELSKKLGSVRLKMKVKTVFLLTKIHDESLVGKTRELAAWLLDMERDTPYIVYVETILAEHPLFDKKGLLAQDPSYQGRLKYWTNDLCRSSPQTFDFVVTLGGDGTVLYASWLFQRIVPPVLSFSLGSLGFLTKFDFEHYQSILSAAFRQGVVVSLRLRFECTVMRSQRQSHHPPKDLVEELIGQESDDEHTHRPDGSYDILNDVVVDRGPNSTMSAIEVFGDDEHFTTVQADGVCVATPTGSTAYNLSAGGSLCHPDNPVILVTAICAHTLSFRPIILPDTIVLRIGVPYDSRTSSWVSFDGRQRVELTPGDYVTISASRFPFANVMPNGRRSEDWINSISRTLNWNSRERQKGFTKLFDGKKEGDS